MKKTVTYSLIAVAMMLMASPAAMAQKEDFNPVQTGVNSLNIAPDARGASMGDLGAATDPDANSGIHQNMHLPTARIRCRSAILLGCER